MTLQYHEPKDELSQETRDLHHAFTSLVEEIEAVDWYQQRMDVAGDEELREIITHNRNEEIEHAAMLVEWLRRHIGKFDEELKTYLNTPGRITAAVEDGGSEPANDTDHVRPADLGIGSTRTETSHSG